MKIWIKSKKIETLNKSGEIVVDAYFPDSAKKESVIDGTVHLIPPTNSKLDLGSEFLCRVAGTSEQINAIIADTDITQLTDDEARKIIKSKYPNSDLENLDVADPEIDEIAKAQGIDPKIRADVVISSRGRQVLQDQENYLMAHICEKIGLTRDYWDTEAAKTKWEKGINIEHSIKDGHAEAHEFVLSRIRSKIAVATQK